MGLNHWIRFHVQKRAVSLILKLVRSATCMIEFYTLLDGEQASSLKLHKINLIINPNNSEQRFGGHDKSIQYISAYMSLALICFAHIMVKNRYFKNTAARKGNDLLHSELFYQNDSIVRKFRKWDFTGKTNAPRIWGSPGALGIQTASSLYQKGR